jgi:hypothetical protein
MRAKRRGKAERGGDEALGCDASQGWERSDRDGRE